MEAVVAFLFIVVIGLGVLVFAQYETIKLHKKRLRNNEEQEITASYNDSYIRPTCKKKD